MWVSHVLSSSVVCGVDGVARYGIAAWGSMRLLRRILRV